MTYYTLFAVRQAPSPSAVRDARTDWLQLNDEEREHVRRYLEYSITINDVPERGRVFLRRYHGEN